MTVVCLNCMVIALLTNPASCPKAAGISAGEGGVSSTFPYLTNVAHLGAAYAAREELKMPCQLSKMYLIALGYLFAWVQIKL